MIPPQESLYSGSPVAGHRLDQSARAYGRLTEGRFTACEAVAFGPA
jgi:hypothetical protein